MFEFPVHMQFDPDPRCNLNCSYCYTHHAKSKWTLGERPLDPMSMELIEKILVQTKGRKMSSIRPFVTGEPLIEKRMPEIVALIKKYNPANIVIYTNGTAYANRDFLMLGLGEVHFTLSAATRETYEIVHGRDLYDQAVKTIEWLEQQSNHPGIFLNFIITRDNAFEIWTWMKKWQRFNQARNRAHGYLPTDPDAQFLKRIQIPDEILVPEDNIIGCNAELPCSFYDNAIITANGELKLCCLSGLGFGNIKDESLETLWHRRCANKGENADCRKCVFKGNDWDGWMKLVD